MHYEDAIKFLIERLAAQPNVFFENLNSPPDFDVWLPRAVIAFVAETEGKDGSLLLIESLRTKEYRTVWIAFYDAASELCRRGIFRASELCPQAFSDHGRRRPGDGYSITVAGREWLKNATARYFPIAPGRYVQALGRAATVLGGGFLQRAAEAAGCHSSGNYLACSAMCGAAAESTLLAIAIAKTGDSELVLNKYERSGGREKVTRLIFGQPGASTLERRFRTGFELLTYWRDEAAHGRESAIEELEAYDSMGRLLYLAHLTWDNWLELTGKSRPD